MDLDGARNAKAEIFQSFGFTERPYAGGTAAFPDVPSVDATLWSKAISGLGGLAHAAVIGPLSSIVGISGGFDGISGALGRESRGRVDFGETDGDVAVAPPPAKTAALDKVAVGIQPSRGKSDVRVVMISSDAKMRDHPAVESAIKLAKGEATFVVSSRPRFLSIFDPPRRRPLAIGVSVGHVDVSAGTLGAFVEFADGTFGVLSNNHVLANLDKAALGTKIIQPGRTDGGKADDDVIASLLRAVPIATGDSDVNHVDCAVALLADGFGPTAAFAHDDQVPIRIKGVAAEDAFVDDPVWKVGSATGLTNGKVFAVEVDNYIINMGTSWAPIRCRFDNQIQVYAEDRSFADKGDSGSVVFNHEDEAIGLLFAGSMSGGPTNTGLAALNPLQVVLDKLDAKFWIG